MPSRIRAFKANELKPLYRFLQPYPTAKRHHGDNRGKKKLRQGFTL